MPLSAGDLSEIRARMLAYMRNHVTMTLATAGAGEAHAATLFYANDGFDIFFLSSPSSVHSEHIMANPGVFLTISQDYDDWRRIQGLQIRGRASLLQDDSRARDVYIGKYPFVAAFPESDARYWHIAVYWAQMIDNTVGFAHKDELDLSEGS